jgi:hypothetical protein
MSSNSGFGRPAYHLKESRERVSNSRIDFVDPTIFFFYVLVFEQSPPYLAQFLRFEIVEETDM